VLTHERNRATLQEVETHWSLEDLVDAHLALDVQDELVRRAGRENRRLAEEARAHGTRKR
jgi:hypothetical protein